MTPAKPVPVAWAVYDGDDPRSPECGGYHLTLESAEKFAAFLNALFPGNPTVRRDARVVPLYGPSALDAARRGGIKEAAKEARDLIHLLYDLAQEGLARERGESKQYDYATRVRAAVDTAKKHLAATRATEATEEEVWEVERFVSDLAKQHTHAERVAKWDSENDGPYEGGDDIEDVYDRVILDAREVLAHLGRR